MLTKKYPIPKEVNAATMHILRELRNIVILSGAPIAFWVLEEQTRKNNPGKTKLSILSLNAAITPKIKVRSSMKIAEITMRAKYNKLVR